MHSTRRLGRCSESGLKGTARAVRRKTASWKKGSEDGALAFSNVHRELMRHMGLESVNMF